MPQIRFHEKEGAGFAGTFLKNHHHQQQIS
jgi:hypothetical protein